MTYRFAVERENFTDYASGKVFYGMPGHPAFPVRLASEIFQRCLQIRSAKRLDAPMRVYDPCCGGAYLIAVLAYLHWNEIGEINVSDVDAQALSIAQRNLSLLSLTGIERRIAEIEEMRRLYKKDSHDAARQSAEVIKERLLQLAGTHPIPVCWFQADALHSAGLQEHFAGNPPDVVITDIPYGIRSQWLLAGPAQKQEAAWLLLESLRDVLAAEAVVAIASIKGQKIAHAGYRQVGKLKSGKRQVLFLEKNH